MTAPISNEPTTTRLHHYAGHYFVGGRPVACYGCGHCINYMPKGSGRWPLSDANLDVIADNRGECPGKTLNWDTPKQCLELLLRT